MNQVDISNEESDGEIENTGWAAWFSGRDTATRVPDSDKEEIPDAQEVVGTEATEVEVFHDGSVVTRWCARTPSGFRALYLGGKSMAVKTRFVFASSIMGGVTGIMCFTLSTNPMYYMTASGCDNASPYFLNANLTSDRWRISPSYGVCPDSGRVRICEGQSVDDDSSCYVQFYNCFDFSNSSAWQHLDEMNAGHGFASDLLGASHVWRDSVKYLYVAAICTMILGVAAIVGDVLLSKLFLQPVWNMTRLLIRSTCCQPQPGTLASRRDRHGGILLSNSRQYARDVEDEQGLEQLDLGGWEDYSHLVEGGREGLGEGRQAYTGSGGGVGDVEMTGSAEVELGSGDGALEDPRQGAAGVVEQGSASEQGEGGIDLEQGGIPQEMEGVGHSEPRDDRSAVPAIVSSTSDELGEVSAAIGSSTSTVTELELDRESPGDTCNSDGSGADLDVETRPRLVSLDQVSVRDDDGDTGSTRSRSFSRSLSDRLSFTGGRRNSREALSHKDLPVASHAYGMAVAIVERDENSTNRSIERYLDMNYEEIVGREWPFFKATCVLQIASFLLVHVNLRKMELSHTLEEKAWTAYLLNGCQDVSFEKSPYHVYFLFVEVVTMIIFLVMALHLLCQTQNDGSCLRVIS